MPLSPSILAALRRVGGTSLLVALVLLGVTLLAYGLGIRLNLSASIPPGLYRIAAGSIGTGTVVMVCLPSHISAFARSRGFVPNGSCADGSAPIGKTVAATAGDVVDVSTMGIVVNGRALRNSRPLMFDSEHRPLVPFTPGHYVVRRNDVWLVSTYSSHSFDSRYFGPVHTSSIVARVRPLLVLR
ncbi:MAG: conjugative transfer signal peptidase TraF [Gemmatimonadaceae bacterium]